MCSAVLILVEYSYTYTCLYQCINSVFTCNYHPPAITVMFSQTTYSVNEGAGPARPVLVLSNPSSFESTVEVFHTNGTALGEYCM